MPKHWAYQQAEAQAAQLTSYEAQRQKNVNANLAVRNKDTKKMTAFASLALFIACMSVAICPY